MRRMQVPLLLLVGALAFAVLTGPSSLPIPSATAQAPKVRQQWLYGSLVVGDTALDVHWQAGETTFSSSGDVIQPDFNRSVTEIYRQLGGKGEKPTDTWRPVGPNRPRRLGDGLIHSHLRSTGVDVPATTESVTRKNNDRAFTLTDTGLSFPEGFHFGVPLNMVK